MDYQELKKEYAVHQLFLNCILGDNNIAPVKFDKAVKL